MQYVGPPEIIEIMQCGALQLETVSQIIRKLLNYERNM